MVRFKRVPVDDATQDEQKQGATPTPTTASSKKPRRRRGRTSSERGKEFRKRQDNYEALLEQQVARLKHEVLNKQFQLSVSEAKRFRSIHSIHGPLVTLTIEYFRMFQFGLRVPPEAASAHPDHQNDILRRQEAYLFSIMDPDVAIGAHDRGIAAAFKQWRLHTLVAHDFMCEVASVPIVVGSDDCPVVQVQLRGYFTIGPAFVDTLFEPAVRLRAWSLLQKSARRTLQLSWLFYLQFSEDKRIVRKVAQADYAQSFLDLGLPMEDVAELLTISRVTPHATIEPREPKRWTEENAEPALGA